METEAILNNQIVNLAFADTNDMENVIRDPVLLPQTANETIETQPHHIDTNINSEPIETLRDYTANTVLYATSASAGPQYYR